MGMGLPLSLIAATTTLGIALSLWRYEGERIHVGLWTMRVNAWCRARRFRSGADVCARLGGWLLPPHISMPFLAMNHYCMGRMVEARKHLDAALTHPCTPAWQPFAVNSLMCVDVADGRYRRALSHRKRLDVEHMTACKNPELVKAYDSAEEVLRVNEAEALASLGDLQASVDLLSGTMTAPIAIAGAALHQTWAYALLGNIDASRGAFAIAREKDLPMEFRSEYYFAEAFLRLAEGNLDAAQHAVELGTARASRASSGRNALYLHAMIALRRGSLEEALTWFELGAAHAYTGQGGPALVEWGDTLERIGRIADAHVAWTLACERDPESPAAREALRKLARGRDRSK